MKRFYLPLVLLVLVLPFLNGQGSRVDSLLEEIAFHSDVMVNATADQHRARANAALVTVMNDFLKTPGSYAISLDSIKWISTLHGENFRLVTWQWKVNEDDYKYGGFIQWPDRIVLLKDTRPFINGSGYNTFTPAAWYGALYYAIIPFKRERETYYLLLGFNAENRSINTKIADVLDLTGDEPKLGLPVFVGKSEPFTRILVSYADVSTVHIRYDKDLKGIIYDHIESLPGMGEGGGALLVSDGSLEGWMLKNGNWEYQEEVYDVKVDTPPMSEERKDYKESKDIMGRPKKD